MREKRLLITKWTDNLRESMSKKLDCWESLVIRFTGTSAGDLCTKNRDAGIYIEKEACFIAILGFFWGTSCVFSLFFC